MAYHGPLPHLARLDLAGLELDETPQTEVELAILQQPPKSLFLCLPERIKNEEMKEGGRVGRELKSKNTYIGISATGAALTHSLTHRSLTHSP